MITLHSLDLTGEQLQLRTLPIELKLFADQLTSLHCANQPLRDVDALLGSLHALRVLYLERGELTALPTRWTCAFLYRLFVRHNRLTVLPESTCRLAFLRELYLSHNQLTSLPDAIGSLRLLEELDVQSNQLLALPSTVSSLESLRLLRLDRNRLTKLPDELCAITTLQDLFVKSNQLTSLPANFTRLVALKRLYTCFNQISVSSAQLCCLTSLQNCSFSNNVLRVFPALPSSADSPHTHVKPDFAVPASLQRLVLSHNSLRWLFEAPLERDLRSSASSTDSPLASPRHPVPLRDMQRCSLSHVDHLSLLDLTDNRLRSLTPAIGDLRNLRALTLGNNLLTALPDSLFRLTRLQFLDVSYNLLEDLSVELRRLTQLGALHLNSNRLETLPDVFDRLPDLHLLLCDKNRLTELPPTLVHLRADANVNLEDNELDETLASLCFLGFPAVRQYLLQPDDAKSAAAASMQSSFEIDFSRITLECELGRGAFGVVHKATLRPQPPRRRYSAAPATEPQPIVVAVKMLSLRVDQIATDAGRRRFVDDFRRELAMLAKTAQSWSFPASVRRHFVGFLGACTQDPFCLVTEYCERGSLFDTLARLGPNNRLHASVRYYIAIEVAEGLHNLHSHTPDAILHHDVKTSNILITRDYAIKLADFGLARVQASTRLAARLAADGHVLSSDEEDDEPSDSATGSLLGSQEQLRDPLRDALFYSSGNAFGNHDDDTDEDDDLADSACSYEGRLDMSATGLDGYDENGSTSPYDKRVGGKSTCFFVPYAAPEILRGARYDIAAETYSFGVVLWCLTSNTEPFAGRSLAAIRKAKLGSGGGLSINDRTIDATFRNLVSRCTATSRELRPSFPTIIAELKAARDAQDLHTLVLPE